MTDWELLTRVIKAANNSQQELSQTIISNDFTGLTMAQDAALNSFKATPKNISLHKSAVKKLGCLQPSNDWSLSAVFKHSLLRF